MSSGEAEDEPMGDAAGGSPTKKEPDQSGDEAGDASTAKSGTTSPSEDFNMEVRRRLKNEARLTSGIGKAKEKDRNVNIFWEHIWPKLEEAGWTKHEGVGAQSGSITFLPKGSIMHERGGLVSGESYDRIRDVLDRLEEGRSQTEAAIANSYYSMQTGDRKEAASGNKGSDRPHRNSVLLSSKMDLSWKDGGRNFPRKTSQIGDEYQVSALPTPGPIDDPPECVILWDPRESATLRNEEGNLPILEQVPPNKHEAALELLASRNYIPGDDFVATITNMPARNGSDWPPEKKARFSELVFSMRKDLHGVHTVMEIDMATCLGHYYGIYKHTDGYRLVKTVLHDEKLDAKKANNPAATAAAVEPDACVICDDGGELLICDGCEGEYHMECMDPPLKSIPDGHWECDECVNQKLLAFRDYLVRQSGLFEAKDPEQDDGAVVFKPTPAAMASVRKMAKGITKLLTPTEEEIAAAAAAAAAAEEIAAAAAAEAAASVKKGESTPSPTKRKRKRKSEAALLI